MMASSFERDGSATVRRVIPPAEVAAMQAVFTAMLSTRTPPRRAGVVWEVAGAAATHAPLAAIARDPRFGRLAAAALGVSRVQLLQDSLLYKPPRTGGSVAWHQDYTYVGFLTPPQVVSVRIPLHAEDDENGCMRVVDGSHTWGPVGDVRAFRETGVTSLVRRLDAGQRRALARARPLVLEPGDVSIHHCLTVHSSPRNHSNRPRQTIVLRLFDADCRLAPERLPRAARRYFLVDESGRLEGAAFPLVYDGVTRDVAAAT
jgi:hypothetical protein